MLPERTEVAIVGAGPTGLALAIVLQAAGVDHVLIDRLDNQQGTSRAAVVHAHTLETMEDLGVVGALVERGHKVGRFAIRDRDDVLLGLDFSDLPSAHDYLLMVPQDETERVLAERLEALGGQVRRGIAATRIEQDAEAARVTVVTPSGPATIAARYVVGADGLHSIVRAAAGIGFDGASYEESFVLADARLDWPLGRDEVTLLFAPAGMVVVAPLPNGAFRIVATLAEAPEHPSAADMQAILDQRGPRRRRARLGEVLWSSRFRLQHRLARTYRNGRLLLIGDAAHVHSPAGGQGMNTGLVDAVVLGRLLAAVVTGRQAEAALDRYGALRRPAAAQVLRLAGGLTRAATVTKPALRHARNLVLRLAGRVPAVRRRLVLNFSGLARKSLAEVADAP
jgi:2-polyprenyl-6-methoxyphenol hydroxylase-like FAD-dependent oxidoreductase